MLDTIFYHFLVIYNGHNKYYSNYNEKTLKIKNKFVQNLNTIIYTYRIIKINEAE
jgi:hypothetical protein